jgi:HAD superfamily hydrolase (TIGR01509 family)
VLEAVVLDVDDTLCLTEAVCFQMENETLRSLGRAEMSRAVHQRTWGMPLLPAMQIRSPGVDPEAFQLEYQPLLESYVSSGRLDQVSAETIAVIDALIKQGRRVMVLTSRKLDELRHLMARDHLLNGRVHDFFHADNTIHLKPDGRVFDQLLRTHALRPTDCVYVGDSPSDAAAANAAGLRFVACLASGLRSRSDFAGYHVDAFVAEWSELENVIPALEEAR